MRKISLERIKVNMIPLIAMFMFAFFPTSFAGVIGGKKYIVFLWGFLALFLLVVWFGNAVNIPKLKIVLVIIGYMSIITGIQISRNEWARLSVARIAPLLLLLILLTIKIKQIPDMKVMERLIDIFSVICVIWNIGILLQFQPIVYFTQYFYSQYYERALYYSMLYRKPVMGFGIHTYAAYYYFLIFTCYYALAAKYNRVKDYILCAVYILLTVLLTSNSSLIYAVVMSLMLLWQIRKKILVLLGLGGIGSVVLWKSWSRIIENYAIFLTNSKSGFRGRYLGSDSFAHNFEVIRNSLGIGFCILDNKNITYSDSGYVMYMTMGGIVLVLLLYFLIILFFWDNIAKPYRWSILFLVLSFETALPGTFSYRFIFSSVFIIYFFRALNNSQLSCAACTRRKLWKT